MIGKNWPAGEYIKLRDLSYFKLAGGAFTLELTKKRGGMKIGHLDVQIFKIKNRKGYAAVCCGHLTEGSSAQEAYQRMVKALRRTERKK